ncbi:VCBS repeat-containing protein [Rhodocytophaga aerolata]|uniref:VCBS repeat-containing protein n=1 Tax=Rhodocytophaga aerolata TaxID=455078 RepID=A0ABT8QZ10_9BACT|nr:VCBS repeat-containing protein [Rhodocytophaga aerolata]MDO1445079.1 VCBS repeat-containing protein [Rhodocytophaga aerolata]
MHFPTYFLCVAFWVSCVLYCHSSAAQFTLLSSKQTGITFNNQLTETETQNVLQYEYFYNGGGVAVGDINNDGLPDLYFTGNMVPDRLYLNQGNLQFKDITQNSGISFGTGWKTGVTLVDINTDGWLDIYVCYSGNGEPYYRRNKLYINNKNLTFTEQAAQYGLDLPTHSTQAAFFDYDKDGDLDCYLMNHNIKDFKRFDAAAVKAMRDEFAGDRLLRNEGGKFTDVSAQAGIKGNPIGFGLGIAISDINADGWPDIYISNDYIEQDYLYINNGNGTFSDKLTESVGHLSYFSMGNEIADINNDGFPDIFTLDMLPEDNRRQKLLYGPENYEVYQNMVKNGFHHQIMRNMLQLNNGNGTFSEIGQLAGISNTDWSWAPLIADFDNDGWKDLFITNGYLRDYTNMDFMKFYADKELKAAQGSPTAMMDIVREMPSSQTQNYFFRNNGRLQFENKGKQWGFDQTFLSNGAVCADLDTDGDLEIITNNVNAEAAIYRNDAMARESNYLQVQLGNNFSAATYGAKVWVHTKETRQYQEYYPSRGFQSCMNTPLHFGLGKATVVDTLKIEWPNGKYELLCNIPAGQKLVVEPGKANKPSSPAKSTTHLFTAVTKDTVPFLHQEDDYNDFKRQLLIPTMLSYQGPHLAQTDVNKDGLPDLYIGGAKGQAGALLLGQKNGSWQTSPQPAFQSDLLQEDTGALFFDADKDGDMDLYVVSGGYAYLEQDVLLQDRLYLNNGKGKFTRAQENLPIDRSSDGCAKAIDIDKDGDLDLFVGGRVIPGRYPEPASSRILLNDGKGKFTDGTSQLAPFLEKFGLVTDAVVLDANKDGWDDLVVAGEWMPITVLLNHQGKLQNNQPANQSVGKSYGWWNKLVAEDLDKDGDLDIVAGNAGWNCQMKPTEKEPVTVVYSDFDQNEAIDPFVCYYIGEKSYPLVNRDEALNQVFALRRKFTTYASYADATLQEMFTPEQLKNASTLQATTFSSVVLENKGDGTFSPHELPVEAQFAPVYGIALLDIDKDGLKDLILGGNQTYTRIKLARMDATYGMVFRNEGNCRFAYIPQWKSGLAVKGDVRDITVVKNGPQTFLLFGRNNQSISSYLVNP